MGLGFPLLALAALLVSGTAGILVTRSRVRRGVLLPAAVGGFEREPVPVEVDSDPWRIVCRLVVGVLTTLFLLASVVHFHQPASLRDLYADAAAHRMDSVTLSPGLPAGAGGNVQRVVTWRTGLSR